MKKLYIFLIVFINIILQVSLYNFIAIFDVIPNIALVLVVIFSLTTNDVMGGCIGLLTGLMYDVLIMDVIGINTLIYFVIGVTLGNLNSEINKENKLIYILLTAVASIFYHFATFIILFFLKVDIKSITLIYDKIIIQIILNCVFCLILYKLIDFIFNRAQIKIFNNRM